MAQRKGAAHRTVLTAAGQVHKPAPHMGGQGWEFRGVLEAPLFFDAALSRQGLYVDPERLIQGLARLVRTGVESELFAREGD